MQAMASRLRSFLLNFLIFCKSLQAFKAASVVKRYSQLNPMACRPGPTSLANHPLKTLVFFSCSLHINVHRALAS
jgi:hypothetical protein